MYTIEDLISENKETVIYVEKDDPYFNKFMRFLNENKCMWHSGSLPEEIVYNNKYYVIDEDYEIGWLDLDQLDDNCTIVHMNEIEYEEQKNIDIDVEVFL